MIKSHGATNQRVFAVATEQAVQVIQRQVPQRIAARLESAYPADFELSDGGKSETLRQQDTANELAVYKWRYITKK